MIAQPPKLQHSWFATGGVTLGKRSASVLLPGLVALLVGVFPARGLAFGTINGFGQAAQHEKITRGALSCAPAFLAPGPIADVPGRCFEEFSMDELAGTSRGAITTGTIANTNTFGSFGAVGAPDVESFFGDVEHCLSGDYLPSRAGSKKGSNGRLRYPQTAGARLAKLTACHDHLRTHFVTALQDANDLVDAAGRISATAVDISDCHYISMRETLSGIQTFEADIALYVKKHPGLLHRAEELAVKGLGLAVKGIILAGAYAEPNTGTGKCRALGNLGKVLHGIQDFYAHSNWTDSARAGLPTGIHNPPGLNRTDRPPLLNMLQVPATITPGLQTACFDFLIDQCKNRIDHDKDLGKDKGTVNVTLQAGLPGRGLPNPVTAAPARTVPPSRGEVRGNFEKAVTGAVSESWHMWLDFGNELIRMYGPVRGPQMICALTHDNPVVYCAPLGCTFSAKKDASRDPQAVKATVRCIRGLVKKITVVVGDIHGPFVKSVDGFSNDGGGSGTCTATPMSAGYSPYRVECDVSEPGATTSTILFTEDHSGQCCPTTDITSTYLTFFATDPDGRQESGDVIIDGPDVQGSS